MQLQVIDGNGELQTLVAQAPATPTDRSGTIQGDVSQILMDANADRAGWLVQNKSMTNATMLINDIGGDADASPTSIILSPGGIFPPPGYPVTLGQITISGNAGDNFAAREW